MALVTRTYISKSNTIVKDSCVNVGVNPIVELNYGHMTTRCMLYFDHTKVKNLVNDKTYPDMSKLHHVLKMTNTASLTRSAIYRPCTSEYFNDNKRGIEKERHISEPCTGDFRKAERNGDYR